MSSGRVGKAIVLTCFFTAGYGRHRKLGVGFRTAGYSRHRSQWVKILGQLVDDKEYSIAELENMNWDDKCRLIQSDPVTCARHFDYQISQFITNFLLNKAQPLGKNF